MKHGIAQTNFQFPNQTSYYKGKVRDVYTISDDYLVIIATDRLSAFDVVLPRVIPFKGQILNLIASSFLKQTEDIIPNWLISVPDPNVSIGYKCDPIPLEIVVRGYLSGHAWRVYKEGGREICGVKLPDGLRENDKLPFPLITPSTKAATGHDMDISRNEIINQGLVNEDEYVKIEEYALALFARGTQIARDKGLILVDTKYEFGKREGVIFLMDEIHTPDSSRYFFLDGYDNRQNTGEAQKQLSKEFVRGWLMSEGFEGKSNQKVPEMTDQKVNEISHFYIDLYSKIIGGSFDQKWGEGDVLGRIEKNILMELDKLQIIK